MGGPFYLEGYLPDLEPLLHTKNEAALMLRVCPRTIDNLIAAKELPTRKIGRRVLIPRTALLAFTRNDHPTQANA